LQEEYGLCEKKQRKKILVPRSIKRKIKKKKEREK